MSRRNTEILPQKPKIILFDLDDTLLPTNSLREHRHSKYIIDLMKHQEFRQITPYHGILMSLIEMSAKVRIGMVTSSPKWYVNQILNRHFGCLRFSPLVTYNDVYELKPHPEPLLLALQLAHVKAAEAIYVGNAVEDFLACAAAKVSFVGAGWSCLRTYPSNVCLELANPEHLIRTLGIEAL